MKKFAYMLAALSLCTVSFVACDDDKDTDTDQPKVECNSNDDCKDNAEGKTVCESNKCVAPAASDKEDCSSNDDCKDNSNGKTVCESNKCVAPSTEEPECSKDADCAENEEGKTSCNAGKCDYPNDDDVCDAASYQIICENGGASAWVCKDSKITKEDCGEGKECKDGQGCVDKVQDGECFDDTDCASKGDNYFCNDQHVCEQKSAEAKDPCANVTCEAGTCDRGVCVTDDMKALTVGGSCDNATFQSFCNGDKTMECTLGGKIVSDDCAADNIGKCTIVDNIGKKFATCSGNEEMLALCAANNSSDSPKATIHVCYGNQDWAADVFCINDLAGQPTIYVNDLALDCEGKACKYGEDSAPVCAE